MTQRCDEPYPNRLAGIDGMTDQLRDNDERKRRAGTVLEGL